MDEEVRGIIIRPAVEADQLTIESLIREAHLNPRNLHWPHFLVAETGGQIVGIRQVKTHKQGTREVASGLVIPEYRGQGISAQLMQQILSRESGSLYLMCNEKWASYYDRFGFRRVTVGQLPPDFRWEYRLGRVITSVLSLFSSDKIRIIPMRRDYGHL
jgi:N-acetylglutamate synthase-like GNAT family acetyltransferase